MYFTFRSRKTISLRREDWKIRRLIKMRKISDRGLRKQHAGFEGIMKSNLLKKKEETWFHQGKLNFIKILELSFSHFSDNNHRSTPYNSHIRFPTPFSNIRSLIIFRITTNFFQFFVKDFDEHKDNPPSFFNTWIAWNTLPDDLGGHKRNCGRWSWQVSWRNTSHGTQHNKEKRVGPPFTSWPRRNGRYRCSAGTARHFARQ